MITGHDFYAIATAMVPLYVAMFLAYGSVKWWKIFTPDQCSGINRFVTIFAVPFLSFHFISMNNPYTMSFRFIAADSLQKIIMLVVLGLWAKFTKTGTFDWMITIFSLSTLPNTLVIGIPLLNAMYGEFSASLMVQVVVMQCIIWYTLLIFFFEFRGAKILIMEKFPNSGADIALIKVDSDVVSLDGQDILETDAEIGDDGKLIITVRRSNASQKSVEVNRLSGAEIYSLSSSAVHSPRGSNYNQSDFYSVVGFPGGRLSNFSPAADNLYSVQWSRGQTLRRSNFEDDRTLSFHASQNMKPYFQAENSEMYPTVTKGQKPTKPLQLQEKGSWQNNKKHDVNMFIRSTSAPIVPKDGRSHVDLDPHCGKEVRMLVTNPPHNGKTGVIKEFGNEITKLGVDSTAEHHHDTVVIAKEEAGKKMPSAGVMGRLILIMVWRKLVRNPNTYANIIGLVWALVSFRWDVEMPKIIGQSIKLISDTGLGMAMFSLGLFMSLQPKLIACGRTKAAIAMAVKFLLGPAVMALAAFIVRLHGTLFYVAILQATLSVGIVPFVFAKEYNVHPTILSTAVVFGMLITVPITICYYIILQL